ncbi:CAP domain-containing protein (plasmid) [Nicoliella spurrieriana]|uniref:CAP domain-containing protein n=1 Tax=Nicoliella spurrieriana TaxID=2925830 RepID=A0A976RQQ7_9LACO|nr:CAP domain-containing protein [Nicoliella spurrieriana]UQS86120.1 CAP domain-containing protein [Nicoliella spurrieriana]
MKKLILFSILLLTLIFFTKSPAVVNADGPNQDDGNQITSTATADNGSDASQNQVSDDNNNSSSNQTDDGDSSDNDQQAQPTKTMVIHYQSIDGKQISNDQTVSTNGDPIYGFAKSIKGYINYYYYPDSISYDSLPTSMTVKYVKNTVPVKQMNQAYLKYLNTYRRKMGLKSFKTAPNLNQRAQVRARELQTKFDHTRPNGTSYNTKNSGYGEVMLSPTLIYSGPGKSLNYKATGQNAARTLLTEDALHRDTLLNKWANYAAVAFYISDNAVTMCGLFKL